jgi:hypothetical protein
MSAERYDIDELGRGRDAQITASGRFGALRQDA